MLEIIQDLPIMIPSIILKAWSGRSQVTVGKMPKSTVLQGVVFMSVDSGKANISSCWEKLSYKDLYKHLELVTLNLFVSSTT
ncbi:hypothetical protein Ancab_015947 [Ancistrocladus abbreviatus]